MEFTRTSLSSRVLLAGLAGVAVLSSVGTLLARSYTAVEVRGEEFVPAADIKAACEVVPGVDYSEADLRSIEDCLMASGAFRAVSALPEGDTLVLAVDELNDRPGRLEFGLAWDSHDGATASLYLERYNLVPGVFGSVELRAARNVQRLRTALYKAEAFGTLGFGLDTMVERTSFDDQGYKSRRAAIEPYLGWPAFDGARLELGLGYRMDEMHGIAAGAGPFLASEAGRTTAPYLRLSFDYQHDTGREGPGLSAVRLRADQIFVFTDGNQLAETRIAAGADLGLGAGFSLSLGAAGGTVSGSGKAAPRATDRFFPGGAEFRGFAPRGIGPRENGYALGAENYYVLSAEVQKSIGDLMGAEARLGLFVNAGSAWGLSGSGAAAIDDRQKLRSAAGLSLTVSVGSVPVSLYLAEPLDYKKGDKRQSFGLSISTSF